MQIFSNPLSGPTLTAKQDHDANHVTSSLMRMHTCVQQKAIAVLFCKITYNELPLFEKKSNF